MGKEAKKGDFQKFEILTASTPLQCQLAPQCQISCRSVKPFHTYGRLLNFSKWRLSAILDFKKFKILTALEGKSASSCQILCKSVKALQRNGRFCFFPKWRPSAILDFQKFVILTARTLRGAKMRHHVQFCADRSRRCGDMAVFDFSRWRRPPFWIIKSWKFQPPISFGGPKCVTMPNFVQIDQTVAEIWPFTIFQDGGRPPSWIIKSWKF